VCYASVDIDVSANLDLVHKFCYSGDMLSVDGDADAAVRPEIELCGINSGSWYHCLLMLTNKDLSLIVQQLSAKCYVAWK